MDNIILHDHYYLYRTNERINNDQLSYNSEEDIFFDTSDSEGIQIKNQNKRISLIYCFF